MLNELSDVLEMVKSVAAHYKISFDEVGKYQIQKRKKVGAFERKLFLIWSEK